MTQLENCRGQTYDGASNMLGKKLGVATQILSEQSRAVVTHCQGHLLSLAVKDLTTNCKVSLILWVLLLKFGYSSSTNNNVKTCLEESENIEGEFTNMDDIKYSTIGKLCVTHWTVRGTCFQKIIKNYPLPLALWEECLKEKLDPKMRSQIYGCCAQMKVFNFYIGLCLG